jgi:hypothetical protein
MLTYKEIALKIEAAMKPEKILLVWIVQKSRTKPDEIKGLRFYVPSMLKDVYLDFIKDVFAGEGLSIHYLNNEEMLEIKQPETKIKEVLI